MATFQQLNHVHDPAGVARGRINAQRVGPRLYDRRGPLQGIPTHPDRSGHPQLPAFIFGGLKKHFPLLNILTCDHAHEFSVLVDEGQLLNAVLIEHGTGSFPAGLRPADDKPLTRGHDITDLAVGVFHIPDITRRHHTDKFATGIDDGKSRDTALRHCFQQITHREIWTYGEWMRDDGILGALDLGNHFCLAGNGDIAMNDTQASLPSQGNGQFAFRDGVHGGRYDGHIQHQRVCQARAYIRFRGDDFAVLRHKQDIIKSKAERYKIVHGADVKGGCTLYQRCVTRVVGSVKGNCFQADSQQSHRKRNFITGFLFRNNLSFL